MHFLHGWKRDRTCELNFQEKGSRYVDIISVYFSGRTGDGSHLPKVKAAGKIILSVAVLAIIITTPIGAIGIDCSYKTLLEKN